MVNSAASSSTHDGHGKDSIESLAQQVKELKDIIAASRSTTPQQPSPIIIRRNGVVLGRSIGDYWWADGGG
jgi:hypothetical protein